MSRCRKGRDKSQQLRLSSLLLSEHNAAHCQDALEALAALDGILLEPRAQRVFDAVLDSLPAAAERSYPRRLLELRLVIAHRRVRHLFLHIDEVAPRQVLADHGEGLVLRVDVAGLEDVADVHRVAHHRLDPFGSRLLACDEALGAEDARLGVHGAKERVDGNDVLGLVVPGAVLLPVGCGYLLPRVVVGD